MPACHYACNTAEHAVSRRAFLGTASAAAARAPGFASSEATPRWRGHRSGCW